MPRRTLRILAITTLATFCVVGSLLVLYELINRTWLSHVDMETVHLFHLVIALTGALLAAGLAVWVLLQSSHPLLDQMLRSGAWFDGERPAKSDRNVTYARWFIQMRWIAVLVATVLILLTVQVAELLPAEVMQPLLAAVGALAVLNLIYTWMLRGEVISLHLLSFQAYADLVLLTVLLHFSGSLENPLAPLMLFHVIIAGIILSKQQCYSVALFGCLLFALLGGLELGDVVHHYTLDIFPHVEHGGETTHAAQSPRYVVSKVVLHGAVLLLTALFVTTLASRMRRDELELERYADRMVAERQLLEQSLDTTHTGLGLFDRDAVPLWQSRQWLHWFGDAPPGATLRDEILGIRSDIWKTSEDGEVRVSEIETSTPGATSSTDENPRTYQTTTAALLDQEHRIDRIVQLVQDVTEQKRTHAGMVRAGQLAAVGEMAGEVAHEVNNPIAIISAKARLLLSNQRDEMSQKTREELEKITELSDRVATIVQGLLSYSRPSAGLRVSIDIRNPIRKASALIVQRAETGKVELDDRLGDQPIMVVANSDEIAQVFVNLFLNAIDAMPEGGRLAVSAEPIPAGTNRSQQCEIVVSDTGIGVPPEALPRVFEPFFTTKEDEKGTGLGLSICHGLINGHGGTISLANESGAGASATIRLPMDSTVTGVTHV